MRGFVIAAWLACVVSAHAQILMTGVGQGDVGGYTGPGDIVASAQIWVGLRAYNSADRGNALVNVCNIADAACTDFSSDKNTGQVAVSTVGGSSCSPTTIVSAVYTSGTGTVALTTAGSSGLSIGQPFAITSAIGTGDIVHVDKTSWLADAGTTGTTINFTMSTGLTFTLTGGTISVCTVKTIYDRSGNAHDLTQSTINSRPVLGINCIGTLPCLVMSSTQGLQNSSLTLTGTVASTSAVAWIGFEQDVTGGSSVIGPNTSGALSICSLYFNTTNSWNTFNGTNLPATATSNAWHAVQGVCNGASNNTDNSSAFSIDRSATQGNSGTRQLNTVTFIGIGADSDGDSGGLSMTEVGLWPVSFSSAQQFALQDNQTSFWKIGTGISSLNSPWIPGLTKMADGRLFVCYATSGAAEADGVLKYQISSAGGMTWDTTVTTIATPSASHTYAGCDATTDASGHIIVSTMLETNDQFTASNAYIFIGSVSGGVISFDGGTNAAANVTGSFVNSSFVAPSKVLILQNGTWLLPIFNDNSAGATTVIVAVVACASCNPASQTWSAQTTIYTSANNPNEASLVQKSNGDIVGVIRVNIGGNPGYYLTTTTDATGATWPGTASKIFAEPDPGKPTLVLTQNAVLYLVGRFNSDSTYYATSLDYGSSWTSLSVVTQANNCYASGFDLDGTRAAFALCQGPCCGVSNQIIFNILSPASFLLKRDLDPAANDNAPAFMEKVA
jgi:hypothetical protein